MALAYVPITLTNNESTATGSGFQQLLLNIDMRSYEPFLNDDLSNVYFSSDSAGSTVINSWLESGNSSTSAATTWWVVTSVSANSTTTIYMQVDLSGTSHRNNTTTGEAPQLSGTYAEYDNGASVFNDYWNFAGTSMPTGWVVPSGLTATVNNGLSISTVSGTNSGTIYYNSFSASAPFILEAYYYPNPSNGAGLTAGYGQTGTDMYNGYMFWLTSSFVIYYIEESASIGFTSISSSGTPSQVQQITSAVIGNDYQAIYDNYALITSGTNNLFTPSQMTQVGFRINSGTDTIENAYWLRTRTYPPSGVMPSVGLGQPTNFPYINTSTNPVEVMDF